MEHFDPDFGSLMDSLSKVLGDKPLGRHYTPLDEAYITTLKELSTTYVYRPLHGGFQYHAEFPNGYAADIVKHNGSYGEDEDLFEVAVMKDGECVYDTPIATDVIGYLTAPEVMNYAMQIFALPKAK